MTDLPPRVAYFPDSFHEINGVAHTSRSFEAFARRRNLPFLCVRAGEHASAIVEEGNVWTIELPRGILSFALEKDLRLDPVYLRHIPAIAEALARFRPDIIHITGPSDVGILGAWFAHHLRVPLAASWHTNVHEYAARRANWLLRLLPERQAAAAGQKIEDLAMTAIARFYSVARVLFAPNLELCAMLERLTERPCYLMPRGVDAVLFDPAKRTRNLEDHESVLGFVGRFSIEKNVALLAQIQQELDRRSEKFHFLVVGHGGEEGWLRDRLPRAQFPGVLRGEALARAYADMDLFVFPSHTDTFGNVVLESLASGVPAVVTPDGGPKTIVRDGETGRVVSDGQFAAAISAILANRDEHRRMRAAARAYALNASWDAVFEGIYARYDGILRTSDQKIAVCKSETLPSEG